MNYLSEVGLVFGLIIGASLYSLYLVSKHYDRIQQSEIGDIIILKDNRFGKLKGYHRYDDNKTVYEFEDLSTGETTSAGLKDIAYAILSRES